MLFMVCIKKCCQTVYTLPWLLERFSCLHLHRARLQWCPQCLQLMAWSSINARGSDIMIPISAAFFNGLTTSSIHSWTRWNSRTPHIDLFLWMNLGTGRSARSIKAQFDTFIQRFMTISVRLMRSRWATRLPIITKMLALLRTQREWHHQTAGSESTSV